MSSISSVVVVVYADWYMTMIARYVEKYDRKLRFCVERGKLFKMCCVFGIGVVSSQVV